MARESPASVHRGSHLRGSRNRRQGALSVPREGEEAWVWFEERSGEGAFYGPNVDLHTSAAIWRSWQMGSVQLDFARSATRVAQRRCQREVARSLDDETASRYARHPCASQPLTEV